MMKNLGKSIILTVMGWLFLSTVVTSSNIQDVFTNNLVLSFDKESGNILNVKERSTGQVLTKGKGGIVFIDGKDGEVISEGMVVDFREGKEGIKVKWISNNKRVEAKYSIKALPDHLSWKVSVSNRKDSQQLLEVRLKFPVDLNESWDYWDGYEIHSFPCFKLKREKMEYTFPMSCVYNSKVGIALGIEPHQYLSYIANGIERSFYYATKMVIDPKQTENVEFILYFFRPNYGYLDAIQKYYDIFPDVFNPKRGIDPRITGAGGYIRSCPGTRRLQLEQCRRFHINWEWCYGPYQKNGDWFPDRKSWIPKEGFGVEAHTQRRAPYTYEEYLSMLKERFSAGNRTTAMMFYIIPRYCDIRIIDSECPDAIWIDKNGKKSGVVYDDVFKGDRSYWVYAYGNSLFKREIEDLKKIVSTFEVRGFAMDMVNGVRRYYGPGVNNSPGRAFDEEGKIYCLETIPYAKIMDYIHTLHRGKYRMGVIANQAQNYTSYLPVFHADAVMHEGPPYIGARNVWPLRFLSGRKLLTWWDGYVSDRLMEIDWHKLNSEEKKEVLKGLQNYVILFSLRTGGVPSCMETFGVPKLLELIPTIIELSRAGFQPVPAVKVGNAKLWTGRFGKGTGTYITISNPTQESIKQKFISIISIWESALISLRVIIMRNH